MLLWSLASWWPPTPNISSRQNEPDALRKLGCNKHYIITEIDAQSKEFRPGFRLVELQLGEREDQVFDFEYARAWIHSGFFSSDEKNLTSLPLKTSATPSPAWSPLIR